MGSGFGSVATVVASNTKKSKEADLKKMFVTVKLSFGVPP